MNRLLLAAAATTAFTVSSAPLFAQQSVGVGIPRARTYSHHRLYSREARRPMNRTRNDQDAGDVGWSGYELQSSYDDRDWSADSGNDWWNDRPERAFPRWVRHNQNCSPDRMWWSGSGWHC